MYLIYLAEVYVVIGLLYAMYFAFWRVQNIDAGAEGSSWKFRLLIIPGSMLLWPFLLLKKFPSISDHDQTT